MLSNKNAQEATASRWPTSFTLIIIGLASLAALLAIGSGGLLLFVFSSSPEAEDATELIFASDGDAAEQTTGQGVALIEWQASTSESIATSRGNVLYDVPLFTGTVSQALIAPNQDDGAQAGASQVEFNDNELVIVVAYDGSRFTVTQPEGDGSPIALERPENWGEGDEIIIEQQLDDGNIFPVENLSSTAGLILFTFEVERDGVSTAAYQIYRPSDVVTLPSQEDMLNRWEARFQEPATWQVENISYTVADGITTLSERNQEGESGRLTTIPLVFDGSTSLTLDLELLNISADSRIAFTLVASDDGEEVTEVSIMELNQPGNVSITIDDQIAKLGGNAFSLRIDLVGEEGTADIGRLQIVPTNQSMNMELASTPPSQPIVAENEVVAEQPTTDEADGESETEAENPSPFLISGQAQTEGSDTDTQPAEAVEETEAEDGEVMLETESEAAILPEEALEDPVEETVPSEELEELVETVEQEQAVVLETAPTNQVWNEPFDPIQAVWRTSGISIEDLANGSTRISENDESNEFGRIESETLLIDVSATPFLKVVITEVSFPNGGQFEVEIVSSDNRDGSVERALLLSGGEAGTSLIDLREVTGWAGNRTFQLNLILQGESASIALDEISISR